MSLDLYLIGDHPEQQDDMPEFNYTYNVGAMWREIFPGEGMVEIDGMTGAQSLPKLAIALDAMKHTPEKFEKLNPNNGWGSLEGFQRFIERLIQAAEQYPAARWKALR